MKVEVTEAQWALAVEIFGSEVNAHYMLDGAGLRRELTLKLLDALAATREHRDELRREGCEPLPTQG